MMETTLNPTVRLRVATHLHFALLRHFGVDVTMAALLDNGSEAREALWVCEASGDAELMALARQFAQAHDAASSATAGAGARRSNSPPSST